MSTSTQPAVSDDVRRTAREGAERHLKALVGRDDVVLREDQWAAIEALAVDRRRALVVQRTGWGKSAVYFVATKLLREAGAGPTVIVSPLLALMRNQIAAAERAGHPGGDDQLHQHRPVAADPRPDPLGRGRRAAGQPRAAQQPRLPRRGAPAAGRDLRPAGGRRGPLHLRLGPRLPPRLPPPAHPPRRAAVRDPGARHHRDRQRPGHRRRRRAARRARRLPSVEDRACRETPCSCSAAPSTASRCGSGSSTSRRPSSAWRGSPTTSPSSRGRASSTA